jgi:exodeoxyribonuclease III
MFIIIELSFGRGGRAIKVCSFNLNSIRAREQLLFQWLEKRDRDIDILCFQELKLEEPLFPAAAFREAGYSCAVYGQKGYNGVAVCAKQELEEVKKGFGDSPFDRQSRFIRCKVGDVTVLCVYAPRGGERGSEKYQYKMDWYQFLLAYLKESFSPQEPLLIAGDFNVALEDRDVYDPVLLQDAIGTMPEERKCLRDCLDWGLVDSYRLMNAGEPGFTWWSYMAGDIWKDRGMRLDYILCTPVLAERLRRAEVDLWPRRRRKPTPSDHAPLMAEFV